MKDLGRSSNIEYTMDDYFFIMKKKIEGCLSCSGFVGHINFQVNIKDNKIQNIKIGNEETIKI